MVRGTSRQTRKRSAKANDIEDLVNQPRKSTRWEPARWRETWKNISRMRANRDAPVDTMGCDKLAKENEDPETFRLQILLSLMLSSQTKDEVTAAAMERLTDRGCNLKTLLTMPEAELRDVIYPVGFNRSIILGVGPKMAHLTMRCAWKVVSGIGVDTHVHRISNRLRWVPKPTKTPEQTRLALEAWLPRAYWNEINNLLVGFGQQTCLPVRPRCSECINRPICPFVKCLKK
ncbi:unnamed protein product [Schistocephalus solidus]|uniref:ENDO3c domain-containing protein n=1 Tax=Schistocephalus solidus TaxID=70667 RepID=A0A183TJ23_SCHSO|nr:unnamed protein product [Schistocephalus solidus]